MGSLDLLPESWRSELSGARVEPVRSGSGGASVFRVERISGATQFLKIAAGEHVEDLRQEIERTTWLASHHINVPAILLTFVDAGLAAVLMSAVPGENAEDCHGSPGEVIKAIACGFAQLHSLPVESCPFDESLQVRIALAKADISQGRIDPRAFHERNLGLTPTQLFDRLLARVPDSEDFVVVHGDAMFANIFIDAAGRTGFLDCGRSGRADRYVDLAVVASEIEDRFGEELIEPFFRAYGFGFYPWNSSKLSFFSDLYELF